jgi:hypothetical protein
LNILLFSHHQNTSVMSAHHEEHSINGQKPVSFTVPLILATVTIFIIVLILSVCDPKTGHSHLQEVRSATENGHGGDKAGTKHTSGESAPDAAGKTTGSDHH